MRLGAWRSALLIGLVLAAAAAAVAAGLTPFTGGNPALHAASAAAAVVLVGVPLLGSVLKLVYALADARQRLEVLATQDELTGVHNRRYFMALAEREWARCRRYDQSAALLLIDADHFRRVNDHHGHLCGDALLREITRLASESLRGADVLARFGGEELIVFLPHTDPLGALDVAERIRDRIAQLQMPWHGGVVQATVSIGVAALGAGHASLDALIHDADAALFAAKEAGRNCVRAAPIQPRRSGETTTVASPR